ncbi:hypothetical protein GGI22_006826, partial [Coemansia erecta]
MAGLFSKALSVSAFALFAYYMLRLVLVAMHIFYPTTHIPLLRPTRATAPSKVTHRLAWQEPFEYEASMYVTAAHRLDIGPGFFNASALVWKAGPQSISQRRIRLEKKHLNIAIPQSMRIENGTNLYAVLFVQKAGQSQPYPNTSDTYLAVAFAQITKARQRAVDKKHALLTVKSSDDEVGIADKHVPADGSRDGDVEVDVWVPHAKSRIHWEIVLDDIEFPEWTMPQDILPYLRVTKTRVRGNQQPYTPILWENPLAVRKDHWRPLTNRDVISTDV